MTPPIERRVTTATRAQAAGAAPLLAAAALALLLGCGGTRGEDQPPAASQAAAAPGVETAAAAPSSPPAAAPVAEAVETTTVRRGLFQATVTASGSVHAPRSTELGPEVGGRLIRVMVDVGDTVRDGAPVFRIDPEPYQLTLEDAQAGLALARAELEQAEQEMERTRRLADQQVVPQQQLDTQVTRHAVQRAKVTQAEARVHRAEQDLERTTVRAPYPGFVVERRLHEGAMLNPASVVLTLQQAGGYEASLAVPEASRLPVRPGDPARILVEGIPGAIESRVRAVNARIDPESRTYEVRVPIDAPSSAPRLSAPAGVVSTTPAPSSAPKSSAPAGVVSTTPAPSSAPRSSAPAGVVSTTPRGAGAVLKAGAFVRAEIDPVPASDSLLLDREAILTRDGRNYVFLRRGDRAEQVPVVLGAIGARLAEVDSGVAEGDQVVVGDVVERLADGAPIRVTGERSLPVGSAAPPATTEGAVTTASPALPVAPAAPVAAEGAR